MARAKAAKSSKRSPPPAALDPEADELGSRGDDLRFEDALARLEGVVDRLEEGELDLEASLAAFEEGVLLSRRCAKQLDTAEQRVEVLVREAGSLTKRLFEAGDESETVSQEQGSGQAQEQEEELF